MVWVVVVGGGELGWVLQWVSVCFTVDFNVFCSGFQWAIGVGWVSDGGGGGGLGIMLMVVICVVVFS